MKAASYQGTVQLYIEVTPESKVGDVEILHGLACR